MIFSVGTITLALCVIACLGARLLTRTCPGPRIWIFPGSKPLPKDEYMALRDQAIAEARAAKVSA